MIEKELRQIFLEEWDIDPVITTSSFPIRSGGNVDCIRLTFGYLDEITQNIVFKIEKLGYRIISMQQLNLPVGKFVIDVINIEDYDIVAKTY